MKERVFTDLELGIVKTHRNDRAKRYIIRIKEEGVIITVPRYGSYESAIKFFQEIRTDVIRQFVELQAKAAQRHALQTASLERETALSKADLLSQFSAQLQSLATEHGFSYSALKISHSKTRWGSCSTKRVIHLSQHLVLLPAHLIEYVMLHELCHTVEMNHGPKFWALLDQCTAGKAKELRKEIKAYTSA
jgi:predicted metal-dependent hydrolase